MDRFTGTGAGVLAALLAALAFALWGIYLHRGLARGGSLLLSLWTLALGEVVCFLPVSLLLAWRGALPPVAPRALLLFLCAGVMATIVGSLLAGIATRALGAARVTAIRLLDPFFAFVIAALFLHEQPTGRAIVGVVLLGAALFLLQRERAPTALPGHVSARGLVCAVLTSLAFTIGSVFRKAGLGLMPVAVVAAATEGIAGVLVLGALGAITRKRAAPPAFFDARYRDLWWSGLAAAIGTLLLSLALQQLAVPVAVAVRNTSPWFALVLVPLLLGKQQRASRWMWASTALLTVGMLLIVLR